MPKCHFNTSAWVFSCNFAAYFSEQNTSGWLLVQQGFQCQSYERAGRTFWGKTSYNVWYIKASMCYVLDV